jgi:putative intracellular protease/amidase
VQVAVLLYDGVSAGEALVPWEVLRRLPDASCRFVAERPGRHRGHSPALALEADHALDEVDAADVLVVPGGFGCQQLLTHQPLLAWLRRMHDTTQWTTAVSTGSVLLAAAGLLTGREATTHWLAGDLLAGFGAIPVPQRVVRAERVLTSVGPAAAIDMSLWVASRFGGADAARAIKDDLAAGLDDSFDPATSWRAAAMVAGWQQGRSGAPSWADRVLARFDHLAARWSGRHGPVPPATRSATPVPDSDDVEELRDYAPGP